MTTLARAAVYDRRRRSSSVVTSTHEGSHTAAPKANHLNFLDAASASNIEDEIREGVTVIMCDEATMEKGRRFTKRTMPW